MNAHPTSSVVRGRVVVPGDGQEDRATVTTRTTEAAERKLPFFQGRRRHHRSVLDPPLLSIDYHPHDASASSCTEVESSLSSCNDNDGDNLFQNEFPVHYFSVHYF